MSDDYQIEILPTGILVGIASGNGVLDLLAKKEELEAGIRLLRSERKSAQWMRVGGFGIYPVKLYVPRSGSTSLFVDGPNASQGRNLSAAITLGEERLAAIFCEALKKASQAPEPTAPNGPSSS
ncbi:MAG TPA: hypothetical protein VG838_17195 [Opitutaceae bacterium]|nr:hypothetical protein [Opitutaceae bacterium]